MKDYFDDVVMPPPPNGSNGYGSHTHPSLDGRLSRIESGLERLGDRVVATQSESTKAIDHMRREIGGLIKVLTRYQLYISLVGMVVAAALAGASIYLRVAGLEVSTGPQAQQSQPQERAPMPTPDALKEKSP